MSVRGCIDRELNKPFPSDRKNKKLQVCVRDELGNIKNVHFGDMRYQDFTQHRDIDRRRSFRARHGCDPVSKLDRTTAKYWACQKLWVFALAAIVALLSISMVSADASSNITSYFRLDEGSGAFTNDTINPIPFNQGNLTNSPAWITGKIGYGLNFTGSSSQYVLLGNNSIYNYIWNFSINMWFNATNSSTGYLIARDSGAADSNSKFRMAVGSDGCSANKVCWQVSTTAAFNNYADTTTDNIGDGRWHMITGTTNATHVSLYLDGVLKSIAPMAAGTPAGGNTQTRIGARTNGVYYTGGIDEVGLWNRTLSQQEISQIYNNGSGLSYPFVQLMGLTVYSPSNRSSLYSINSSSISIPVLLNTSGALTCYYNSTFNPSDVFFPCGMDNNAVTLSYANTFGTNTIRFFANDSTGTAYTNQTTIWIHRNYYNGQTGFETQNWTHSLEVWNQTSLPAFGILNYNGSNNTGTITAIGNGKYTINYTLDIPLGVQSQPFRWFWNNGDFQQTGQYNQTVNGTYLVLCNATVNTPYANFSFKNETTPNTGVNASIVSAWSFWLGSGTISKSYSLTNSTVNPNYAFCASPGNIPLNANTSITYEAPGFGARTYTNDTMVLSSSLFSKVLYLLDFANGQYVTFQVVNQATQPIAGVAVTAISSIGGTTQVIGSGVTDSAGSVTFFLNPLQLYTLSFEKFGYTTFTTSLVPSQTSYTISLSGESSQSDDYTKGIAYTIKPTDKQLLNGTDNTFNLTLTSTYWTLDSFGFNLRNSSGSVIASQSSMAQTGGSLYSVVNTANNSLLIMEYFWVVNSTYNNASVSWIVYSGDGSEFSIFNFFTDLSAYMAVGMFGLDNFGLALICFSTIFIFTGVMSYKYGLNSPAALMTLVFTLVLFFDVGLGIIPYPPNVTMPFPTIFTGIVLIAILIKEGSR